MTGPKFGGESWNRTKCAIRRRIYSPLQSPMLLTLQIFIQLTTSDISPRYRDHSPIGYVHREVGTLLGILDQRILDYARRHCPVAALR